MNNSSQNNLNKIKKVKNKRRILIVDDNKMFRDTIKRLLEDTKLYYVQTAQDGKVAINLLKQHTFDLLITDYEMPEMNGYELFKKCKTIRPRLPVVFITGSRFNERMIEKAKTEGVVGCIYKPFDISDVTKMVDISIRMNIKEVD
ncbi:MAG: putative two-component response regulator protein [Candidatus Scalindua rubra]|uniref:Putative two-component response regulator protein n=1 Tax=Candidatus Scalindua rubra TaxID=1872076 RepID=A0A1E3XDX0_9BACT|nr:MAG: putative two-component response regulator protein [Candidatus Scalindua rubra]